MQCYFLQGLAGIGVLAAAIFVIAIVATVLMLVVEKVQYTIPQWVKTTSSWVFGVPLVALFCFVFAATLWALGGEVVHNWFHFCVGGGK